MWEYESKDLVTLCEACHDYESFVQKDLYKNAVKDLRMSDFSATDLKRIFQGIKSCKTQRDPQTVALAYKEAFEDPLFQEFILDWYYEKNFGHIKWMCA